LEGIITDGDLRRMLENGDSHSSLLAKDIMSPNPKTIAVNSLAYDTLRIMEDNNISQIIVMDKDVYVGIVHIHEILKEGIL
jgi:arabinose-5-phosphate isomerase